MFAAACVPVVAAQLAFNEAVSGALGPPAMNQASWADPSSPFHRADQALLRFSSAGDYLRYAAYLLVGDKGLISYTPLALVCAYGFVRMAAAPGVMRRIALAIAATFVLYFVLMVAFTDDYGALNYGQRRYVDLFFLLCVGLGPALAACAPVLRASRRASPLHGRSASRCSASSRRSANRAAFQAWFSRRRTSAGSSTGRPFKPRWTSSRCW